ncbi:MAG TPA: hypothetical protein VGH28_05315 [Polyangiaceae bacterium]|jgi:hypothetical protein
MKRLSSWPISAAVALALAGVLGSGGCTTHGEGGRCDPGNKSTTDGTFLDCDTGLTCVSGSELELPDGGGHPSGNFCCPVDRTGLPLGDICLLSPTSPGSDASIGDSAPDSTVNDATTDQSNDVVTSDAPVDSPVTDAADDSATDASGE